MFQASLAVSAYEIDRDRARDDPFVRRNLSRLPWVQNFLAKQDDWQRLHLAGLDEREGLNSSSSCQTRPERDHRLGRMRNALAQREVVELKAEARGDVGVGTARAAA